MMICPHFPFTFFYYNGIGPIFTHKNLIDRQCSLQGRYWFKVTELLPIFISFLRFFKLEINMNGFPVSLYTLQGRLATIR